jgi:hypothetical protein
VKREEEEGKKAKEYKLEDDKDKKTEKNQSSQ